MYSIPIGPSNQDVSMSRTLLPDHATQRWMPHSSASPSATSTALDRTALVLRFMLSPTLRLISLDGSDARLYSPPRQKIPQSSVPVLIFIALSQQRFRR